MKRIKHTQNNKIKINNFNQSRQSPASLSRITCHRNLFAIP